MQSTSSVIQRNYTFEIMSLRCFGLVGILIFLPLFVLTFIKPNLVESSARFFIESELRASVDEKIEAFRLPEQNKLESILGAKAQELSKETEQRLEQIRIKLKEDMPSILADELARLRNLNCECRNKIEQNIRDTLQSRIVSLERTRSKIVDFSHAKYMDIVRNLTSDVRIFLAVNSVVFLLLLFASLMRPTAVRHLFFPGALMVVSTIVCSYFYLFEQNWIYSIIFNDYTGFAYLTYLLFVFAMLCDIVFNRARITTEFLNGCLQSVGAAASLVSC